MARRTTTGERPGTGLAEKRRAILDGALTVFARDGYSRASIDAIAAEAEVSTRTIYNHFADKARLFHALIQDSATRVAEAEIAVIDRYLRKVTDLEADLIEFGRAWATPTPDHATHFALVRHLDADVAHIAPETITAWQEAGPLRVRRELANHLQLLADQGLLRLDHPERAALHLIVLTTTTNPSLPTAPRTPEEITEAATAGVRAFLYGYSR